MIRPAPPRPPMPAPVPFSRMLPMPPCGNSPFWWSEMVSTEHVLAAPTVVDHDAERFANGDAVGADVRPRPHLVGVVTALDVHGGVVAADGTGLLSEDDNNHRGRGGEEGTAHSRHHSPTKAIWIATVVISSGRVRQLRNLWRNRRRLPNRHERAAAVLAESARSTARAWPQTEPRVR